MTHGNAARLRPRAEEPRTSTPPEPSRAVHSATTLAIGALALVAGFLVSLAFQYALGEPTTDSGAEDGEHVLTPAWIDIDVSVEPVSARLWLDGQAVGTGRYQGEVAADGARHELRVEADGYTTHVVTFRDRPPQARVALLPDEPETIATRAGSRADALRASGAARQRAANRGARLMTLARPAPTVPRPRAEPPLAADSPPPPATDSPTLAADAPPVRLLDEPTPNRK